MKILLAPDKFKGSLSARGVGEAIAAGLESDPKKAFHCTIHPMADGGDGSLAILKTHLNLRARKVSTINAAYREIEAEYYYQGSTAFVEVASAAGLAQLHAAERNPLFTTTEGVGRIMNHAIEKGATEIFLFLGGSATNDAGIGIAASLGFQFLHQDGRTILPVGQNLGSIRSIVRPENVSFPFIHLLCDVDNPFHGPYGAARVYAGQKGATPEMIERLDAGLKNFDRVLANFSHSVANLPGAGAAGGIAGGLHAMLGAKIENGFDTIARLTHLEEAIMESDVVISGEGRLDEQSFRGKVIGGIAKLCRKYGKPLYLFVGESELPESSWKSRGIEGVKSIMDVAPNRELALKYPQKYLTALADPTHFPPHRL